MDLSNLYSDFLGTFREYMYEVVPKKQVKVAGRRKRPPWYYEEVQKARHGVNILSRTYKRRKTPSLEKLREKENEVDVTEENAKKKLTEEVCGKS